MPGLARILIVDDSTPWRHLICAILEDYAELQFVGDAADGEQAVQEASELKPDLILLDIGLPHLNGIEAARRIRQVAPDATILFLSMNSQADVVREGLNIGAKGYVLKTDALRELWPAIQTVLQNKQFVSSGLRLAFETGEFDRGTQAFSSPRNQE